MTRYDSKTIWEIDIDSIDTFISHMDMGYLVTLGQGPLLVPPFLSLAPTRTHITWRLELSLFTPSRA